MFYAESIGMPENFPALSCSLTAIKSRRVEDCLREKSKTNTENANDYQTVFMGEHVNRRLVLVFVTITTNFLNNILLAPPCTIIWKLMERHPTARAGTHISDFTCRT